MCDHKLHKLVCTSRLPIQTHCLHLNSVCQWISTVGAKFVKKSYRLRLSVCLWLSVAVGTQMERLCSTLAPPPSSYRPLRSEIDQRRITSIERHPSYSALPLRYIRLMEEYYPPLHCKNINIAYNLKIEKLEPWVWVRSPNTQRQRYISDNWMKRT